MLRTYEARGYRMLKFLELHKIRITSYLISLHNFTYIFYFKKPEKYHINDKIND